MIEPIKATLTKTIINSLAPQEIIYAEVAGGGANGNAGGILIYSVKDKQIICYETSKFTDQENYSLAEELLLKHTNIHHEPKENLESHLFDYVYGGLGNNVFIHKNANLEIKENYFLYLKDDLEYAIYSSVQGVFNGAVNGINQAKNAKKYK
jgi:hypothetical protein